MTNPGLVAFALGYIHPLHIDPREDDPDLLDEEDNRSDYIPPVGFGRWRNPGHPLLPTHVGPAFAPGEKPENVIHGEIISPEEEAGANSILNGEHESSQPSGNPDVEAARHELHTPPSKDVVGTLSSLLRGRSPQNVGGLDEAHDYLSRYFTGLKVNPHHGTLVAISPTGTQLVKRETHLPAVPDRAPEEHYTLTNKHGIFESQDPDQLVRAMVAFQIMHNEAARRKKDDDQNGGLATTSGFLHRIRDAFVGDGSSSRASFHAPPEAVFEPGSGIELNEHGVPGGYVMRGDIAPPDWYQADNGTAYSPGHSMRLMYDPAEAIKPRPDTRYPGHDFTYAPNSATGHTLARRTNTGILYYVRDKVHPVSRGPAVKKAPATPVTTRAPRPPAGGSRSRSVAPPPPPSSGRVPPPAAAPGRAVLAPPPATATEDLPPPPLWERRTSSAGVNELCPVCASGYLEPYDREFHECLNCGSLVKHVGFEKKSGYRDNEDEPSNAELDDLFAEHDRLGDEHDQYRQEHGMAHPDDWSDLPAGETRTTRYDRTPEGGLVERHWEDDLLFPHEADARPRGGLGSGLNRTGPRGLGQNAEVDRGMELFSGDPLDLASGGSENPENTDDQLDPGVHPLADEELPEDYIGYAPPRQIVGSMFRKAEQGQKLNSLYWRTHRPEEHTAATGIPDEIDEFMGKQGFQPIHKGDQPRSYFAPMPGARNTYVRLTQGSPTAEGRPSGWALFADHVPPANEWTNAENDPQRHITIRRKTLDPTKPQDVRRGVPDLTNRLVGDKSLLATGTHPIEDDTLNRAIRDVMKRGRGSAPYWKMLEDTAYEPPTLPGEFDRGTQKQKRMLSSVNPGLARFVD